MESTHFDRAAHWQNVYQTKADSDTSWFQDDPSPSLQLITQYAPDSGSIIDVGGGQSALAGRLAENNFDVTVIDISSAAIDRAKFRIGATSRHIKWIVGDITQINVVGTFDMWHDRAVFHFLTDQSDQEKYVSLCTRSVSTGGHAVIGAFALDGPEKCSGLPVQRYDGVGLAHVFRDAFTLVELQPHQHITPWGKPQAFTFVVLRRN